jgi:hypothetical protein
MNTRNIQKLIFLPSFLIATLIWQFSAYAAEDSATFAFRDISVSAVAKSTKDAKESAVYEGAGRALKEVLAASGKADYEPTKDEIENLRHSVDVINEKQTAQSYSGTIRYRFRNDKIKEFIKNQNDVAAVENVAKLEPAAGIVSGAQQAIEEDLKGEIMASIPLDNLEEWQKIKAKLSELNQIQKWRIKELSSQQATITIDSELSRENFANYLKKNGFDVINDNNELFITAR